MYKHKHKIWCKRCNIFIDEFTTMLNDADLNVFICPGCGDEDLLPMMSIDDYLELMERRREKEANTVSDDE